MANSHVLSVRLLFSQDIETVTDACWALSYMSDGPDYRIQAVLNAGVAPRLIELLGNIAFWCFDESSRACADILCLEQEAHPPLCKHLPCEPWVILSLAMIVKLSLLSTSMLFRRFCGKCEMTLF